MLRHIVLLHLAPETEPDTFSALVDALRGLPALVDAIVAYDVHTDAGLADGNADVVVVADFDDADGWRDYQSHAAHQQVLTDHVRPVLAARTAVQYQLPAPG